MLTQIIYRNDGRGNIQVLPIAQADMPDTTYATVSAEWDAFYSKLTAQYCPDASTTHAFLGMAKATIYQSTANIWAVFGFDVRRGLDDHTIRFVRYAYRNEQACLCWPGNAHPPMAMRPDIARDCVKGWTELGALPTL